jgi:hypothetical protein
MQQSVSKQATNERATKVLLNIGLLLSSLIGYMEWGGGNYSFIFQVEYRLLTGAPGSTGAMMHPFVLTHYLAS